MADYSRQQDKAFEMVSRKGSIGKIVRPGANGTPDDPKNPWEGNRNKPVQVDHPILILPLERADKMSQESDHQLLVPGKGLEFEPQIGTEVTDSIGRKFSITALSILAPNPAQVILYTCEVALWPGR